MKLAVSLAILGFSVVNANAAVSEHVDSTLFAKKVVVFNDNVTTDPELSYSDNFNELQKNDQEIILEASINSLTFAKATLADGVTYDRIMLPNSGGAKFPGAPNIESYSKMVSLPYGAEINLIIEDVKWSKIYKNVIVDPTQLPFPDVVLENGDRPDESLPFVKDIDTYNKLIENQYSPIQIVNTLIVRNKRYVNLEYQPIDYNPKEKTVRFATSVRFKLGFHGNFQNIDSQQRLDPMIESLKTDVKASLSNELLIDSSDVVQSDPVSSLPTTAPVLTAAEKADYLIISPPAFIDAIKPLAEWKRKKGYQVYIASTAETGNTQQEIKDYIRNSYLKGTMTSYVLLVGDHEDVSGWEIKGHPFHGKDHTWVTDYTYTLVDGNDEFADLSLGRLPGDTAEQITHMVERTLKYEKKPEISDRYNHVLLAGQFQDHKGEHLVADRMFMEDLNRIADFLGPDFDFYSQPGDPFNKGFHIHTALQWDSSTTEALKYGGWNYGRSRLTPPEFVSQAWKNQGEGDRNDISRAINQGVGLVFHRDHGYGSGSGWADPHFTDREVNGLANNQVYPVVFSLNCATGWFDGIDSFAESWMRNTNGGAVGFTGAARVSYSGYNDLFHVGVMDAFWDDYDQTWSSNIYANTWKPAEALNRAKQQVFSGYSVQDRTAKLTARLFNWFGDPDLELRTSVPQPLYAFHSPSLEVGSSEPFEVSVRTRSAVTENARVALVFKDGRALVGKTDNSGRVTFNFTAKESFTVTVTEHNGIPYEEVVIVKEKPKPQLPVQPKPPSSVPVKPQPQQTPTLQTNKEEAGGAINMLFLLMMTGISVLREKVKYTHNIDWESK
ncbi:C25 family cysteine peptidase [Photobacterium sanguinicancri]|uniref:C25 family cysteine peptidase n=1 Tax=Photobacterium sanguinicancri TaxID=875932 RepID=UPI0021C2D24E|nr:C25 family cysteine peptidase [Photobacterium sanguinicancri]